MTARLRKVASGLKEVASLKTAKPKLNSLSTDRARVKFKSELVRILYYIARGYEGPHPWGISGRPPYPERSPVPLKDSGAESELRESIEEFLADSQWDTVIRRMLRELNRKI